MAKKVALAPWKGTMTFTGLLQHALNRFMLDQ
jgi:hypothetical protein